MQIVTLTTDFGTSDYYIASLKGAILKQNRSVQFVDISHNISTYDIVQAAFFIKNTYKNFPNNTIHIAAVQNFQTKNPDLVGFKKDEHFFLGPNNGLFSLVFPRDKSPKYGIKTTSQAFNTLNRHLAHAVAVLSHGLDIQDIGPVLLDYEEKIGLQPVISADQIRATIIHIDHFGNVIVNLEKKLFDKIRKQRDFKIYYNSNDPVKKIRQYYGEVGIGDVVCIFNDASLMEIAVNMGNAHELLGLRKNETIQIDFF